MHLRANKDICIQSYGVAMGSSLGPLITNIFMVELESVLVSKLNYYVKRWRPSVNETFKLFTQFTNNAEV